MIQRILLLLLTTGCLALGSHHLAAQEPDAENQAKIAERDRLFMKARLIATSGQFDVAIELFERAYTLEQTIIGPTNEKSLGTLDRLAQLAESKNDDQALIDIRKRQLFITEQLHGKDNYRSQDAVRLIADAEGNAARPLEDRARLQEAKNLNVEVVKRFSRGDYVGAIPIAKQALAIREALLGKQHPDYSLSLFNLAAQYRWMGDYPRAEPLYREAMAIDEKVLGKEHPSYATSLNNLAGLYDSMGEYPRAEPLYREAVAIRGKVLGKAHPDYAGGLNNLAGLYDSMGDYPRAEPLYREAVAISLGNLERAADVQSERQQVGMAESLRYQLDSYLSLASREPKFQEPAYAALLRWKGSVWQRQLRQQAVRDQPSLLPRFTALQDVSSKLSTLILNPPTDPSQSATWQQNLEKLTEQRENLQRDLAIASVAFRQASTPVTPEQLRESLSEQTMLVDFLEYRHFTLADQEKQTKESWERRLLVHLVHADEDVQAIDLGDVASLNKLVQTWRQDVGQSPTSIDAASELRQRIWQPLEKHLDGITTVYVSPDGVLGQFPLAALPGKRPGSYLIEDLSIVMLPVPQGLPAMVADGKSKRLASSATEQASDRFCLVGGVDYEKVDTPETPQSPSTPYAAAPALLATRGGQWHAYGPLPGTEAEIDTIETLIRAHRPTTQTTILRGGSASESAFAQIAPGNRFLHVATHGFFAPETVKNAMTASTQSTDRMMALGQSQSPKLVGQHPDLLSGLVFAGANQEPQPRSGASSGADAEDGILTAAEVQSLDLRGVDLAVLSACETGLGKTAGGEGIIGLQRAFQLAGAKTTITSLWKVDDAATQALMVEFYRNLFERKLGKLESLRQAQLWMLNHPNAIEGRNLTTRGDIRETKITSETQTTPDASTRSLPAYWAAFQLSGDPQ